MSNFSRSTLLRTAVAVAVAGGLSVASMPAQAQWRGGSHAGYGGYHGGYGYRGGRGWGPGAIIGGTLLGLGIGAAIAGAYVPPPVYYAPPPPAYYPPPGYYAPPPGYYAPPPGYPVAPPPGAAPGY